MPLCQNLQIQHVGKWRKFVITKNSIENVITCLTKVTKMLLNLTSGVPNNLAFPARVLLQFHNNHS
jgi:hypothetical protein